MESGPTPRTHTTLGHQPRGESEDRKNTVGNGDDSIDRGALGITHELEAIAWYRQVAAQGNKHAQFLIGLAHLAGQGVPRDYHEAAEWFQKAADQGHPKAQQYLDFVSTLNERHHVRTQLPRRGLGSITWKYFTKDLVRRAHLFRRAD